MTNHNAIKDREPKNEDEWKYIWSGAKKAHDGWFVVKVQTAIFGNFKVIIMGLIAGLILGGQEILEAWGMWK